MATMWHSVDTLIHGISNTRHTSGRTAARHSLQRLPDLNFSTVAPLIVSYPLTGTQGYTSSVIQ